MCQIKNTYSWDLDTMGETVLLLQKQREILKEQESKMAGVETRVQEAWKSVSGQAFSENVAVDLKHYKEVLVQLTEAVKNLEAVKTYYFAEAEEKIRKKLNF